MLKRDDFRAFFAGLHDGHPPFAWQERLLDELLDTGRWPHRVVAPTGAGKTAAIDVHVFAVALTAGDGAVRLPRRLAMVVGRRVLVDDQYEHAEALGHLLTKSTDPTVVEVANQLRTLRGPSTGDGDSLVVARLRGGAKPARDWRDHPTACAVICATPDMWGSRLLFGGYGSSTRARAREAGMFAFDTAVVVDEAHLSQQLLTTARRVAQLATVADEPLSVPALQVVETTATPSRQVDREGAGEVGVAEAELTAEPQLDRRLRRPKPVTLVASDDWPATTGAQRRRVAQRLADEAAALLRAPASDPSVIHTVGCYVNTVPMAVEVAHALRSRQHADGAPVRVVTVCGQARPADLARLRREHPGLLDTTGDPTVDVLVTTQSLEVGVDLDLAAVVTELAPASALAQRAGRVNRRGLRAAGPVHVIVPAGTLPDRASSGPYGAADLAPARDWLDGRVADPAGLAPWAVRCDPPPAAARRRMLHQQPELADVWHWARTVDSLAAEPQLDLWLAESFDEDRTVGLVVRDAMPTDPGEAVELIQRLPPQDHEVFPVSPATARAVMEQALHGSAHTALDVEPPQVVRCRDDDTTVVDLRQAYLRPGDVVVVDSRTAAFTVSTAGADAGFSPPVPVTADEETAAVRRSTAADVLHDGQPTAGRLLLRLEPAVWPEAEWVGALLQEFAEAAAESAEGERRTILRRLLASRAGATGDLPTLLDAAVELLNRVKDSDLFLHCDDQGQPVRLVLVDRRRAWADEQIRQVWLPQGSVTLDSHQAAVAGRAQWVARHVGLPEPLVEVLRLAGAHHDDGKADPRFQTRLGAGDELLAKSDTTASWNEFRRQADGVPPLWRHEQRSVVACWPAVHGALPPEQAQLAARLVGTSHGHGRTGFPHTAEELLHPDDSSEARQLADDLFDVGGWDQLIETTHQRWGVWGCAYLEALLRAADGQVSAEGR